MNEIHDQESTKSPLLATNRLYNFSPAFLKELAQQYDSNIVETAIEHFRSSQKLVQNPLSYVQKTCKGIRADQFPEPLDANFGETESKPIQRDCSHISDEDFKAMMEATGSVREFLSEMEAKNYWMPEVNARINLFKSYVGVEPLKV